MQKNLDSSKDYVDINSVVDVIRRISESSRNRIYNVASGYNISHKEIVHLLRDLTGCSLTVAEGASANKWSLINIDRIRKEFDFKSLCLTDEIEGLVNEFKKNLLRERSDRQRAD